MERGTNSTNISLCFEGVKILADPGSEKVGGGHHLVIASDLQIQF